MPAQAADLQSSLVPGPMLALQESVCSSSSSSTCVLCLCGCRVPGTAQPTRPQWRPPIWTPDTAGAANVQLGSAANDTDECHPEPSSYALGPKGCPRSSPALDLGSVADWFQGSGVHVGGYLVQGEGGDQGAGQGAIGEAVVGGQTRLGGRAGGRLGLLGQLGILPVQAADQLLALCQLLLRGVGLRPCRQARVSGPCLQRQAKPPEQLYMRAWEPAAPALLLTRDLVLCDWGARAQCPPQMHGYWGSSC